MSRIYEGCGTRNWSLHAVEGRFFVKEYPGQTNVDEERQALDLAMYARDCGIPTPRVIATCSEDLICRSGDTMHREAVPVTGTDGTSRSSPWGSASSLQHARVKAPLGHVALAQIRRGRQAERNRSLHTDHPTKARAGRLRQKDASLADRTQTARSGSSQDPASPPYSHNSGDTQRLWPSERDVQGRQVVCRSRFPTSQALPDCLRGRKDRFWSGELHVIRMDRESIRPDTGVLQSTQGCHPRHLLRSSHLACAAHSKHVRRQTALHSPRRAAGSLGSLLVSTRPCGSDALREPGDCTGDSEVSLGDKRR